MNIQLTLTERRADRDKFLRCQLEAEGLLEGCSDQLISQLAAALVDEEDLQLLVDRDGIVYETASRNGSTMKRSNPAYTELKDVRKAILKLLAEIGMTPASRKRLGVMSLDCPFD